MNSEDPEICYTSKSFVAVHSLMFCPIYRSDLPGYLADSEADGVCVINWYHKQFKIAANQRYFVTKEDFLYFHSYMADYFLGKFGA